MNPLKKVQTAKLTIVKGPQMGSSFVIKDEITTIGRYPESTICLADPKISKTHCQILLRGGEYLLMDMGSRNGTYLEGNRLVPWLSYGLYPECKIELGDCVAHLTWEPTSDRAKLPVVEEITIFEPGEDTSVGVKVERGMGTTAAKLATSAKRKATTLARMITIDTSAHRNFAILYRLLSKLGTSSDVNSLLKTTTEEVADSIQAERVFLFLKEDIERENFAPKFAKKCHEPRAFQPAVSRVVLKQAIRGKAPIWTVVQMENLAPHILGKREEVKVNSILCVPIQSQDEVLGLLYLDTMRSDAPWSKDDIELLGAIGLQVGVLMKNRRLVAANQELFLGVIKALHAIIEGKDRYTSGHTERVTLISVAMAEELNLGSEVVEMVRAAALLHDIGKVIIPENILNKPGKLTDEEFCIIKKHPVAARDFLKHISRFEDIIGGILHHHERYDGKGYLTGIAGDSIPLIARIIAVADAYDAMRSDRAYRKALNEEVAIKELKQNQGTQFDPKMVEVFLRVHKKGIITVP